MKVLVVDDSRSDRKIIRYNFEWHGYQVLEAANGRQGLELALAEKPDLIISDALMPIMDGFQFLHELKGIEELRGIPFLFYSAVYTGNKEEELALSLGAKAFIRKPKGPDELWEEVGKVLALENAGRGNGDERKNEKEFFRNYSQVVATKLEEKVKELSEANENILRLNAELEQRVRERTAQLEAANRELEMFSYSVSHDLRAPLRHMDGFSQALLEDYEGKLDATGVEYLERIRKSSRRMCEMIDAMLDLSRFSRGQIVREDLDLTAMVREICADLAKAHPGRKVNLRIREGVIAWADARLVRVVMENLLSNAWKFTSKRSDATIEFTVTEREGRPTFIVRDNGAGFEMTYADKLFAPFQRLHSKEEFSGNGIGLATVRRIINRHGGTIWVEAEPDKGATFYFTL
ncbi:ATP-binding protein [Geomonas sp. RF6]|uniref:sensor histidine kinase n=1 Tax=Geomonas sp. RF6 TaxID=2897342 RepID=UPI001E33653D|nr:ATP-binding protein [Geomonas sp. RF6]UFS71291.1 ATP-binding protein [Geomonas sp. RF6]